MAWIADFLQDVLYTLRTLPRAPTFAVGAALVVTASMCAAPGVAQTVQMPAFKSGIELVAVDVQVVDSLGYPIDALKPDSFDVMIDGHHRRVVSADLTKYVSRESSPARRGPTPAVSPETTAPKINRMFVIAIDEPSFHPLQTRAVTLAADGFIDRLEPGDYVGAYAYPTGALELTLTRDHESVKKSLEHVTGLFEGPMSNIHMSPSEALDIEEGDHAVAAIVVKRECGGDRSCPARVRMEADALVRLFENQAAQSLAGLRGLIQNLSKIDGRKTLVIVSGGLMASDRAVGRLNMHLETWALGREALKSNVSIYVLHLDNSFMNAISVSGPQNIQTMYRDANLLSLGLELLAGDAGGALIHVEGSQPERAFERVERETSAYYLLGVEPADADRDGKPHTIRVSVKQRGATVRSRAMVTIPAARR